jgi:DNA-binding NarL/FixJ family response regulator
MTELTARLAAGRARYLCDWEAGRVGKEVQSRSRKNLAPCRPRREVDPEKVAELRCQGLSWRAVAERLGISVGTAWRGEGISEPHPAP